MNQNTSKKSHWTACLVCSGQGKVKRAPSKKRKRIYQNKLDAFSRKDVNETAPVPPHIYDVCSNCTGSGIVISSGATPSNFKQYPHVAIVGGGIGGAALAVACLHRGIPFTLYERDECFSARSQGYGLTLQQASKAVAGLGIPSLPGSITSTRHLVHDPAGKVIGEWGLRKWQKPQADDSTKRRNIHVARQTLRSALLEQLTESESVKWGYTLQRLVPNQQGGIDLEFATNGSMTTTSADLVVGADGIRSTVREALIGEKQTPLKYLSCIVILGICPLSSLEDTQSSLFDSETVFQTVNGHERIYVMPYNRETIMWQVSFPLAESEANALTAQGQTALKAEAMRRLREWHDPVPQIIAATDNTLITGYPVYDRALLEPTALQNAGAVTLIGDAAHPMSPFKGQGANQALLDALTLARNISAACEPESNWRTVGLRKHLLQSFEKEMLKRSASKVTASARAVELLHSDAVMHEGDEPRGRGLGTH